MGARASVSPSEVVDIAERVVAIQLAVRGDFVDEIAALQAERAAHADELRALGSKKAIERKLAEADEYAAKTKADADVIEANASKLADLAEEMADKAREQAAAVGNREREAGMLEARLAARQMALDERERKMELEAEKRNEGLTKRQQAVEAGELALRDMQRILDAERGEFNAKLEKLRA